MTLVSTDIHKAAQHLTEGDVVAIPTETVYGLAANIYNEAAIRKIYEIKKRPLYNPLIVHLASSDKLESVVEEIPEKAVKLADHFWPGPLTLILPKKKTIPNLITSGKATVAVRVPRHKLTLELLKVIDFPLAAPSANPFGSISPTRADHVAKYFGEQIPMVLDGGECSRGIESSIIGFENGDPVLYRMGSISIEEIQSLIGSIKLMNKEEKSPAAPGMLARHYAPATPTVLVENAEAYLSKSNAKKIGLLSFDRVKNKDAFEKIELLSVNSDLEEAARNLYAALHRLDNSKLDLIIAERFPDIGLGRSINDRLERAVH